MVPSESWTVTPSLGCSSITRPRTRPPPEKNTVSIGAGAWVTTGAGATGWVTGAGWASQTVTEPSANSIRRTSERSSRRVVPSASWMVTPFVGLSSTTVPIKRVPSAVVTLS